MTDVALREELARAMAAADGYWLLGDPMPPLPKGIARPVTMTLAAAVTMFAPMLGAALPIIARERAAALAAATPLIEARVRDECAQVADGFDAPHLDGVGQRISAAIREG